METSYFQGHYRQPMAELMDYVLSLEQFHSRVVGAVTKLKRMPCIQKNKEANSIVNALAELSPFPKKDHQLFFVEKPNRSKLKEAAASVLLSVEKQKELRYFLKIANSNDGAVRVCYEKKQYNGRYYGRYYPKNIKGCATQQSSNVRAAIYGKSETDIDIENCAFSVLKVICEENYLPCDMVKDYILNREAYLESISMTSDQLHKYNKTKGKFYEKRKLAKRIVTSILYSDGLGHLKHEFQMDGILGPKLQDLYNELEGLKVQIIRLPQYEQLVNDIRAHCSVEKKKFHAGRALSFILSERETEYVTLAMDRFKAMNIEVRSYAFDGFLIACTKREMIEHILTGINAEVPVNFIIKEWPESLLNDHFIKCWKAMGDGKYIPTPVITGKITKKQRQMQMALSKDYVGYQAINSVKDSRPPRGITEPQETARVPVFKPKPVRKRVIPTTSAKPVGLLPVSLSVSKRTAFYCNFKGHVLLRCGNVMYDPETKERVGQLTDHDVTLDSGTTVVSFKSKVPVTLSTPIDIPGVGMVYTARETNNLYQLINGNLVQCIGEIEQESGEVYIDFEFSEKNDEALS